ncbi:MAG: hypothetical protein ACXVBH_09045 [Flavisolibacter sp.]
MRTYLLTGIICLACSSFSEGTDWNGNLLACKVSNRTLNPNMFDVTVHRLSGERVMISWHTEAASQQTRFEVMRKHGPEIFSSLGIVEPKLREDNSADYAFVDINSFGDSSFYCVKKTDSDGVVFFSMSRGIEGVARER